jgi:thiol-disulfide isomerase/thioredoxin
MKNIISIIILVLILASCNKDKKADYIVLNGSIKNANDSLLIIRNNFYEPIDSLILKNNNFGDTLNVDKGYYYLNYNNKTAYLYLDKGYNLNIDFDNNNFLASLNYSGKGSIENTYLASKDKLKQSLPLSQRSYSSYAILNEKEFLKQSDSINQAYIQLFNKNKDLDNDFKMLESKSIEIENAVRILQFESQKQLVEKNPDFKVTDQYPNPYKGIKLNSPELFVTYQYITFVHTYFNQKSMDLVSNNENSDFFIVYQEQLANANLDTKIKDKLGLDNATYGFTYTKDLEKYYQTYIDFAKTEKYINSFNKLYNVKKSEKGGTAIGFEFEGIDGKIYNLDNFKDKYIYIDIWASWCAPCIIQIPHLKKLEEKFNEKINFISIAWNDNKSDWKKMIEKKNLQGIQLFASNKDAEFFKFFGVSGIPRFILLDKEGKIIESNAKQPSEKSLINQLEKLE